MARNTPLRTKAPAERMACLVHGRFARKHARSTARRGFTPGSALLLPDCWVCRSSTLCLTYNAAIRAMAYADTTTALSLFAALPPLPPGLLLERADLGALPLATRCAATCSVVALALLPAALDATPRRAEPGSLRSMLPETEELGEKGASCSPPPDRMPPASVSRASRLSACASCYPAASGEETGDNEVPEAPPFTVQLLASACACTRACACAATKFRSAKDEAWSPKPSGPCARDRWPPRLGTKSPIWSESSSSRGSPKAGLDVPTEPSRCSVEARERSLDPLPSDPGYSSLLGAELSPA